MNGYLRSLHHTLLGGEAKGLVATVESDELGLEHCVSVDLETGTLVTLNTSKAGGVSLVDGGKGDRTARNLGHVVVTNSNGDVGESSTAGVDETTDLGVELGTLDLGVVGIGDLLINEKERCTGVGNGIRALGVLNHLVANSELGGGELPESSLSLDRNPGHLAGDLGSVDLSEVVAACTIGVEVGSEHGHVEIFHNVVEEGLRGCLLGAVVDSVEVGESKTDETVSVSVLNKRLGDRIGQLDDLVLDLNTSNGDSVRANDTSSTGAITIADFPLRTGNCLERSRLSGIKCGVLTDGSLGKLGAEHPPECVSDRLGLIKVSAYRSEEPESKSKFRV